MENLKYQGNLCLIVAMGLNHEIGAENKLIWHLKDDLKNFKEITAGHPVIMGRKTFEAIGRPLPNRTNIVISRSAQSSDEAIRVTSLESALEKAQVALGAESCFIIGGGQIYAAALPFADTLYITAVQAEFPEADTYFPNVNFDQWNEEKIASFTANERNEYAFDVFKYTRKS